MVLELVVLGVAVVEVSGEYQDAGLGGVTAELSSASGGERTTALPVATLIGPSVVPKTDGIWSQVGPDVTLARS